MKVLEKIKEYAKQQRIAATCDGEDLDYEQLDKYSDGFATYIIENYKEEKSPIIIYGNKDNLILTLMMGALKSGRAYIPLDVTFPVERVNQIIEEVKADIIINFTEEELNHHGVYKKQEISNKINDYVGHAVSDGKWVKEDENAYILFTSGSTGKPKGVQISTNNLDSFADWISDYLNYDEREKVIMNQAAYSFDLSVTSIYLGLVHGKTLFSLSKKTSGL